MDFRCYIDREQHRDILPDLLEDIRVRMEAATVVLVKAHAGDPGNEAADLWAGLGCLETEALWDRNNFCLNIALPPLRDNLSNAV
jgi:hypothetical protein